VSAHQLLLASAGTGKTWRLTNRFLGLLLEGVPPERILGTTFTRMAAGEILDRVLGRLADAATDPRGLAELRAALRAPELSAARCRELLHGLVRRLDRFQICTLDAFFVRVAQLYAFDLGLAADWRILDEAEEAELRNAAISEVLGEADRAEWIELLRALTRDAATRPVARTVDDAVRAARDVCLESDAAAWDSLPVPAGLDDLRLGEVFDALETLPLPCTAKGEPRKHWVTNVESARNAIRAGDWAGFLATGLAQRVLDDGQAFGGAEITGELRAVYLTLARQAQHVVLAHVARRNAATRSLVERFELTFARLKRGARGLRFEDLPQALAPAHGAPEGPLAERRLDLWFRLDARIDHMLLDEFQDTAPVQWRVLSPIAEQLLSTHDGTRSFFCVGDVKQSIYGWRRAEPGLLLSLQERIAPERMSESYRSSPVVLDTVRRVFGALDTCGVFDGDSREVARRASHAWRAHFDAPLAAHQGMPGHALLLEARAAGEDEDAWRPPLELAADRVAALAREAPRATIGVLFRTNKGIPLLMELLAQRGVRASGEGGNPLTDSRAVQLALSLLHLADHPDDTVAAFHVATSPLAAFAGLAPERFKADAADAARGLRARLVREGYGAFCAALQPLIEDGPFSAWDQLRFGQLVDVAYAFDPAAGLRPSDLVDRVRALRVETPSTARVKVMTVHMSKGLEFDAVVLPELDGKLSAHEPEIVARRDAPADPWSGVSHAADKSVRAMSPELTELYEGAKLSIYNDALCVLYVALTRAARRLEMIVQADAIRALTYAAILRATLAAPEARDGVLWSHPDGAEHWFEDAGAAAQPVDPPPLPERLSSGAAPRALPTRSPSSEEGGRSVSAAALLRTQGRSARARGELLHRWLEEVEWLEDLRATDDELLALGAPLEHDPAVRRAALAELRAALERPRTRALLSRGASASLFDAPIVWRERSFSEVLTDDAGREYLCSGVMDRVVLYQTGGETTRAEVIDFKSDHVRRGAELEERARHYAPQLASYRRALACITGLAEERVEARLSFLALDEVVTV
jgi:ATP-dependent exoDNAse (exonuclease V) beta subunit